MTPLHVLFFHLNVDGRSEWLITPKRKTKSKEPGSDILYVCLLVSRWMTIFTPAENILVASHKAHRILVKLHVFQIPRDQSLLVKIGQQWPAM